MSKDVVLGHIRAIYAGFHGCALPKNQAKKMRLKAGRLCDICESLAKSDSERLVKDLSRPDPPKRRPKRGKP